MPDCLFVYGTLRSEFDNRYARLLRKNATLVEKTTVRGSIYRVRHYPAYRPQPDGEVRGELYRLHDPAGTLQALDEYEGEEFERVVIPLLRNTRKTGRVRAARITSSSAVLRRETAPFALPCGRGSETEIPSRDREGATNWIYQYKMQPAESSRIASGDFCAP